MEARSHPVPIAVSVQEAIRLSGIGKSTVYALIASGKLKTRQVGRRRLVLYASLVALLDAEGL